MIFIVIIMIITVWRVMVVVVGDIQWSASHFRVLDPVAAAAVCSTGCSWCSGETDGTHVADNVDLSAVCDAISIRLQCLVLSSSAATFKFH